MDPRKKPPKLSWGRSFGKRRCFSTFWKCRKNNLKKEPEKDARETESISPAQSKFTPRFSRSSIFIFRRECWEKTSSSFPADLQGGGWVAALEWKSQPSMLSDPGGRRHGRERTSELRYQNQCPFPRSKHGKNPQNVGLARINQRLVAHKPFDRRLESPTYL